MALERTGLQLELKGHSQFVSGLKSAQQASDRLNTSFQKLSAGGLKGLKLGDMVPQGALDRLKQFTGKVDEFGLAIGRISPQLGGAINLVAGLTGELGRMGAAMSFTTLGAVALGAALVGLGMRGAAMPGVIQAFSAVSHSAGVTADALLRDLRQAARGTVADMELMKQANVALAGAGPQLAAALGKGGGLAGLLEIARVQARATGQDVDYLYQSLVSGIKRSSPMLIDNTGLVLKLGEANEAFAESVGKTVDALSAEEKQIALLNATLEAGRQGIEQYGQSSLQASEYIARMRTTITNTLDRLALSVQPIFTLLTNIADTILTVIVWPLQNIVIPLFYELANTIFGPISTAFDLFKSTVGTVLAPALDLIHHWVVVVVGTLRTLGRAFQWIVQQAARLFAPIVDIVVKYIVEPFTKLLDPVKFAESAGRTFAAYAEGIMWAANTLIFPAVLFIAETIRDLLMGFSPPKKGPLSTIDQGAANVMRAWLEGFTGVSLAPVSDMMGRVNTLLGDIALLTHDQVTALLERLDAELQPFIDNLEIAKALAQSVLDPLQRAEDAMKKRLDAAVQQFTKGGLNAEAVRALDRQNEALAKQKSLWEGVTAEAEYQLALKQSEQAVLRAMLAIQQARTKPDEALAGSAEKVAKAAKEAKKKKAAGDGEIPEPAAETAAGEFADLESAVGEFLGVTDEEIDALFGDMGKAFTGAFMTPGVSKQLDVLKKNRTALGDVLGEIGETPGFQKLTGAFDSVFGDGPDSLKSKIQGFVDTFKEKWDGLFGDTGSVSKTWDKFKSTLEEKWNGLFGDGGDSLKSKVQTFVGDVTGKFKTAFSGADTEDSILWHVNKLKSSITDVFTKDLPGIFDGFSLSNLTQKFRDVLGVDTGGIRAILNGFRTKVRINFDAGGIVTGFFDNFSLSTLAATFESILGLEAGSLQGTLDSFKDKVKEIFKNEEGGAIYDVMAKVGNLFTTLLVDPVAGVLDKVIGGFEGFINKVIDGINKLIDNYNDVAGKIWEPLIIGDIQHVHLGRIRSSPLSGPPTPVPGSVPAGASGGLFGRGLLKVHGGEVLMQQGADRMAVFPKKWVNAMDRLATAMVPYQASAAPAPVINVQGGGGGVTNHNTFNVQSQQSMRLALARARAFGA